MIKKLLTLLSIFLFIYNTVYSQQSIQQTAKVQSERWVAETVFPYFKDARFPTKEECFILGIKSGISLTVFENTREDIRSVWGSSCYEVKRNGTLLFENELCSEDLFNYFTAEYEKISIYADSIAEQVGEYLGPLRNSIYFSPPTEELREKVEEEISNQNKAICLINNAAQVSYLGKEYSRSKIGADRHSKFYACNLFFAFDNEYTKTSSKMNALAVIVFLDENMNILNGEVSLKNCDYIELN